MSISSGLEVGEISNLKSQSLYWALIGLSQQSYPLPKGYNRLSIRCDSDQNTSVSIFAYSDMRDIDLELASCEIPSSFNDDLTAFQVGQTCGALDALLRRSLSEFNSMLKILAPPILALSACSQVSVEDFQEPMVSEVGSGPVSV